MARFIRRFSTKIRESHGSENSPRDRLLFTSTPPPPSPTSDESSGELIIQPRELTTAGGLPLPTYHPFPRPRVAFNTLHFIKQL